MEKGLELVLDDDSKYIVEDYFEINGKEYAFLYNRYNIKQACLVSVENDIIHKIDDSEFKTIYDELIRRNKEDILKYLEDIVPKD